MHQKGDINPEFLLVHGISVWSETFCKASVEVVCKLLHKSVTYNYTEKSGCKEVSCM